MSDLDGSLILFADAVSNLRQTQRELRAVTGDIGQALEDDLMAQVRRMKDGAYNEYEAGRLLAKRVKAALKSQEQKPPSTEGAAK